MFRFTTTKKGKYNISVCLGTACYVKGSQAIFDRLKERVGIEEGQTTEDGLMVVGDFLFGKIQNKKTTYYVRNKDGEVIPCVKCIEDNPKI